MIEEKEKIIKSVLGSHYYSGKEILFYCPFCDDKKKKLSINIQKGCWKCWRAECGKSGNNLGYIVNKFGNEKDKKDWSKFNDKVDIGDYDFLFIQPEVIAEQRVSLPDDFISLVNKNLPDSHKPALKYLHERGITRKDILKWKIGYCDKGEFAERIIIPSFNENGWINYYVARSYSSGWPRYKNPPISRNIIFNELYLKWDEEIILVEGVFDAIKAGNAIPLLGSTLRDSSVIFETLVKNQAKVLLALDSDAQKKSKAISRLLSFYGIENYSIDTNGYEDVAIMSRSEFKTRKEDASLNEKDNYLLEKLLSI
jgi:DNA primase